MLGGSGSEVSIIGVILYIVVKDIVVPQFNRMNGRGDKPGKASTCIEHGNKLTEIETEFGNLKEANTREHDQILTAIEKLRR